MLKYSYLYLLILFFGCQKKQDIPYGASVHYSQTASTLNSNGPYSFTGIDINPNPVQKGTVAKVTANATGKNLTFKWSTPHGDIFGTGSTVYYSDSCIGTYQITCRVSDGTNSVTITVDINIID